MISQGIWHSPYMYDSSKVKKKIMSLGTKLVIWHLCHMETVIGRTLQVRKGHLTIPKRVKLIGELLRSC